MRILVVLALVAALGSRAHAQPGMAPLQPVDQPQPARVDVKDETTATALSLGATTLGYVMMYLAVQGDNSAAGWTGLGLMLIGPSAGHIYAGETAHAAEASLVRAGGLLLVGLGLAATLNTEEADCIDPRCGNVDNHHDHSSGELLIVLGATTFVGATLYDLYDAHRAAHRTNAREWLVTPTMMQATGGGAAPALAVAGRF